MTYTANILQINTQLIMRLIRIEQSTKTCLCSVIFIKNSVLSIVTIYQRIV